MEVAATGGSVGAEAAGGGRLGGKLLILRLTARGLWRGRRALGPWDGAAQDAERAGEAEAVGVGAGAPGGLIHHGADGEMGEQQPVDLLDDLAGVLAAERAGVGPLVGLDLVQRGLDLPPLVVGRF